MKNKNDFNYKNMITLTQSIIDTLLYFNDGPIKVNFNSGHEKLVVVTGDNATGKSFVRRVYHAVIKLTNNEVMHLSQEGRCSSGIPAAMIYGDESYNSTGYLTSCTVSTGIRSCKERTTPHYIIWDEPDIGLSEKYAGGVGVEIRKFVENLSEYTKGVIIITHSKAIVRQLVSLNPSHLRVGDCLDLKTWLNRIEEPGSLEELEERNHTIFKAIQKILDSKD